MIKVLKKQLISSSTDLLTVISNKIVGGLEVLLSIQKGTVVCVCVDGGGGCSFGMCSFRSSDMLFLAIWQNFCITDAFTTTVKFFW